MTEQITYEKAVETIYNNIKSATAISESVLELYMKEKDESVNSCSSNKAYYSQYLKRDYYENNCFEFCSTFISKFLEKKQQAVLNQFISYVKNYSVAPVVQLNALQSFCCSFQSYEKGEDPFEDD
jgi:hypothetical protein